MTMSTPPPPRLPTPPLTLAEQRREAVTDAEWRKSSLNLMFRGFVAPRGTYKVTVCSATVKEKWRDDVGGGGGGRGGWGARGREAVVERQVEEVEDQWILSYVLAPPDVSCANY